jgi:hypothetical protein
MVQKSRIDDMLGPYLNGQGVHINGQSSADGPLDSEEIGCHIFIQDLMEGIYARRQGNCHQEVQTLLKTVLDRGAMNGLRIPGKRLQINGTHRIPAKSNLQIRPFQNDRSQTICVRNKGEPVPFRKLEQIESEGLHGPREFLGARDPIVLVLG